MSEINWNAIKKTGEDAIKPLEEGRYRFRCERPTPKIASTGSPMIVAHMVVQGGPKHGKDLFHNFVLTVDNAFALNRWFENLAALGIDESFWEKLTQSGYTQEQSMQVIASVIDGRLVDAEVTQREWQGKKRNDFKTFFPVTDQAPISSLLPSASSAVPSGVAQPSGVPSVAPSGIPQVSTPSPSPSVPAPSAASTPPALPF